MAVFSIRLRELRQEKKLSMKQLAKKINTTDGAISNWENGVNEPKISYLIRLAVFFEVSADYLLGLEDETGAKTYSAKYNINSVNHSGNGDIKFS